MINIIEGKERLEEPDIPVINTRKNTLTMTELRTTEKKIEVKETLERTDIPVMMID
jgi:carbohydrate-binding DOMON domain-containing protein